MVDPEDDLPVDRVLEFCSRELLSVDSDTSLDLMFQQVESGRSHLYFVQNELSEIDTAADEVRERQRHTAAPPQRARCRCWSIWTA